MGRKLYHFTGSPPCQTVLLLGSYLGLDFEMISINPLEGETRTEEFIKINPQHTIPVLIDEDGFIVRESRTICRYLAQKYGNHSLYPEDLKARTEVDSMLDFDAGTLSKHFVPYFLSIFKVGQPDEDTRNKLTDALSVLETILDLSESGWVCTDQFTLADIALFTPIQFLQDLGYDFEKFTNITKWATMVSEKIPEYETVVAPTRAAIKHVLESRQQNEQE